MNPVQTPRGLARVGSFALVLLPLAAVAGAAYLLRIEEGLGFDRLLPIVVGGFVVHAWLPRAWRQPFFLLLGLGAAAYILGPIAGGLLVAAGLALIGICHLPLPYPLRVALVLAAGGGLAALRAGWLRTPWSTTVLPILGAMFMFRLIIYLYDLRHERHPASVWARLSYFFLLPGVCFPLFPVVDYRTFNRTYYDGDAHQIYQKGVRWLLLGVIHLLLYRAVYLYLVPAPSEIVDLAGVLRFAVAAYLQYLRISGMFHVIVGVLCLFGFNLPATNSWYFLAGGFTDLWRRINIYWKDFLQKTVYFPVFMRARKLGVTPGMVLATIAVFVCSWLLHSYQWFWLRGDFPLSAVDVLFWSAVGLLLLASSLRELWRGPPASRRRRRGVFARSLIRAASTLAVFATMCVLWSLWCSDSLGDWYDTIGRARTGTVRQLSIAGAVLIGVVLLGAGAAYVVERGWSNRLAPGPRAGAALTTAGAALLLGGALLAPRLSADTPHLGVLASLSGPRLSAGDAERRTLGYYEGLLDRPGGRAGPIAVPAERAVSVEPPPDWIPIGQAGLTRRVEDYRGYDLRPDQHTTFKRAVYSTNQFGMRDQHYPEAKPPGTFRIALLGSSPEMGSGVADGQNYESLLEERLVELAARRGGPRYEVLNFGVAGWGIVQQVAKCEQQVFDFEPDAVLLAVHSSGDRAVVLRLFRKLLRRQLPLPAELERIVAAAGVDGRMKKRRIVRQLTPYFAEITRWGYRRIVELCRQRGARPIWAFVPLPRDFEGRPDVEHPGTAELREWAVEAGFETISVAGVFDELEPSTVTLAPWDNHPNELGSRLIADRLYEQLVARPELIGR